MTVRRALFQALEGLRDRSAGGLVRRLADGSHGGAIFAAQGRICWATSAGPSELSDLLQGGSGHAVPRERLDEALRRSREEEAAPGSVALASEDALRRELLRDICEAIRALVVHDGSWEWVNHDGLTHSPALAFGVAEVSSALSAQENPTLAELARQRLERVVLRAQHGFTLDEGELMPLAHVGCGALPPGALFGHARQAQDLMALGQTALATGLIAAIDGATSAIWREDRLLHVVVDPDGNAVNRLVPQLAAATGAKAEAD